MLRSRYRARSLEYPAFSLDFVNQFAAAASLLTTVRAGATATYFDSSNVLQTALANILRQNYGLTSTVPLGVLLEGAATNIMLWNRDFTNVAWVAVNVTPLKNITGIDNVANSASRLTADANSGTILQTVTIGSAARTLSFYVKRITGTGTISITQDGLSWTAITVTAAWTRVTLTATQLNPVVGFQFATSGDAIAVDYGQLEAGTYAASPIATTTASVVRAIDACSIAVSSFPYNQAAGTAIIRASELTDIGTSTFPRVFNFSDGTANNYITIFSADASDTINGEIKAAGSTQTGAVALAYTGTVSTLGFTWASSGVAVAKDGAANVSATGITIPSGITTLTLGNNHNGAAAWNGHIERFTYIPRMVAGARLQAMTM